MAHKFAAHPPFDSYHPSRTGSNPSTTDAITTTTAPPPSQSPYLNSPPEKREGLRPFLTLAPRLWLTTLNPAFLPLIFTIIHIAATRNSTADLAASLKDSVYKACKGMAKGAGALRTLPRYLAMQTNEQVLKATRATVLGTGLALIFCIQVINAVVNFIVDTYRGLLLCTIQLVVQGSLEILIGAVREISDFIENTLNSIRNGIQDDIAAANSLIQKAADGIKSALSLVGINFDIPEFSIPKLSWLQNVTIPTGFEDSLVKLNAAIPDLNELREKMNHLVDIPFEMLIKEINTTRLEIAGSLNDSIYPVPSLSNLAGGNSKSLEDTLCTDLNTAAIDDTAKALYSLGTIAIWAMVVLVLAAWAVLAFWQWYRWRALKNTVEGVEADWAAAPPGSHRDAWSVVAIVEHPVLERYTRPVFDKFNLKPRTRNNVRWFLSYLGHPTCLILLFMSLVGLIAIQCQLVALHALQAKAERDATQNINASTADFAARLNAISANASREYATDMNNVLKGLEDRVNNEMFGTWINGTAITLNNTLVEFYDEVEKVLNLTFGGTILFNPVNNFVYCILGSKIVSLEKGLTWVSEHAHITLPLVSDDVLLLSSNSSQELAAPLASAAVGDDANGGAIGKLVLHFEKALRTELLLYSALICVYGVIFCVGLAVVLWHSGGKETYTGWRARRNNGDTHGPEPPNRSTWQWSAPVYGHFARKEKDLPPNPEKKGQPSEESDCAESLSDLAAPGQAYLRMEGGTHSRAPSPRSGMTNPLPTLPSTPSRRASSENSAAGLNRIRNLFPWPPQGEAPRSLPRSVGTPVPFDFSRTLTVANRSSNHESVATSAEELYTPAELEGFRNFPPLPPLPTSTPPTPPRVKTPIAEYLLPAIERRKRALEKQVNPFVEDVPSRDNCNPFEDHNPFKDAEGTPASSGTARNPFIDQ